jgi:aminoglycoside N3'-acetyltransferase
MFSILTVVKQGSLPILRLFPKSIKSSLVRWLHQRKALNRKKIQLSKIKKYGTFSEHELLKILRDSGIQEGDILFVQCSFNDLYTFSGNPLSLLQVFRNLVGQTGTLLMPAFTTNTFSEPSRLFDPDLEPTYTGLVNELFRRSPGVIRSLHPRHSICGEGPLAFTLLANHENCVRADGPDSPFDRLRKYDRAKILTLGLPPAFVSFLHWVEDFEPEKLPFPVHEKEPRKCLVKLADARIITVCDWLVTSNIHSRLFLHSISKNLSVEAMQSFSYKGIEIGLYPIKALANELINLRNRGIFHYK